MNDSGRLSMTVDPVPAGWLSSAARRTEGLRQVAAPGVGYLAVYALFDWVSSIDGHAPFADYSWNPDTGASMAFALIFGRRMIPFMFLAPLLGHRVLQQLAPVLPFELASGALFGAVYAAAALFLLHPARRFDRKLMSMSSLLLLAATAGVSSGFAAAGYAGLEIAAGVLPSAQFAHGFLSYWVGDAIGILVITPFALICCTRPYAIWTSPETLLQLAAIVAALVLVFVYWRAQHLEIFYVLFVPIVWMAVRSGIEGVIVGILLTQLGLALGFRAFPDIVTEMPNAQALMLVLALTGLFSGALVTQGRHTEAALSAHKESLARFARFSSVGELAAALAHELNQPLMAAGTYARLVDDGIRSGDANADVVAEAARKTTEQVERAAEVVRRLRALVRLDRSNRVVCEVNHIVQETVNLCRHDLDRVGVKINQSVPDGLPPVMIDKMQIKQALLNLLQNSMEAIGDTGRGFITVEAGLADASFVEVRVRDTGPGFPSEFAANPFLPFSSGKKDGLGIGLPLCRSIVEAHGGRIWLEQDSPGATVRFTLPVARLSVSGLSSNG